MTVGLVAPTGSLAFGITNNAMLAAEETVGGGPVERLAAALYDRRVAVVRFLEGIDSRELEEFLALVPRWPATDAEAPLWDQLEAAGVTHVRLEPLDFSSVLASEGLEPGGEGAASGGDKKSPGLLATILRRFLSEERFGPLGLGARAASGEPAMGEIVEVIRRVLERHGIDPGRGATGPDARSPRSRR